MDQKVHVLFERALDAEPEPPAGDLALNAMSAGRALRRRRHLLTGGALAGIVTVAATLVALNAGAPERAVPPPVVAAGALMPPASLACDREAGRATTDVRVFLRYETTGRQRDDLRDTLRSDPLVRSVTLVSREEAYATFKEHYRNNPDLVEAVQPEQFPESFDVRLARAKDFPRFVATYDHRSGIDQILGDPCLTRSGPGEDE
ncbi:permease-like cell division protein FtsX [Micromonospora endolithica]|uniref:FtsX extracellular domain-containing protein n=1 Tax=Micromonospora endolithica TaxID=230091 RepID=A0A3A9Z4R1_9ACTN|nr:permease-like cell division protein FtsX [Micromonospora endolithica]RKN42804.1 hypothetical protein D7223_22550 [Micromonospora endolithica]TWJ25340.1 hypothetical protein JD76_05508 [Micromonospora endolithica]